MQGRFVRPTSQFRNWVTPDGGPGPTGRSGFTAEAGRYHLYVSLACPWSHRTLIFRAIKGLSDIVTLSVVHWRMGAEGWTFEDGPGIVPDPIFGARALYDIYKASAPTYTGQVTVPVLMDKQTKEIVSNESSEIIRMMNSAFDYVGAREGDYYPQDLRTEIDQINSQVYTNVNNGVYRAGFATSQAAYEEAILPLFKTLDELETLLGRQRFLCGARITEADWRLFATLVRFDSVYVGHFKCNLRRLSEYPIFLPIRAISISGLTSAARSISLTSNSITTKVTRQLIHRGSCLLGPVWISRNRTGASAVSRQPSERPVVGGA
jgi:glutathionyl-hydroquinone reductase